MLVRNGQILFDPRGRYAYSYATDPLSVRANYKQSSLFLMKWDLDAKAPVWLTRMNVCAPLAFSPAGRHLVVLTHLPSQGAGTRPLPTPGRAPLDHDYPSYYTVLRLLDARTGLILHAWRARPSERVLWLADGRLILIQPPGAKAPAGRICSRRGRKTQGGGRGFTPRQSRGPVRRSVSCSLPPLIRAIPPAGS